MLKNEGGFEKADQGLSALMREIDRESRRCETEATMGEPRKRSHNSNDAGRDEKNMSLQGEHPVEEMRPGRIALSTAIMRPMSPARFCLALRIEHSGGVNPRCAAK